MPARAPALKYGLVSAFIAFVIALQPLCAETFGLIFADKAPLAFTTSLGPDAPIPRSLVWSGFAETIIFRLGSLSVSLIIAFHLILWLVLIYCLLRLLNPTF